MVLSDLDLRVWISRLFYSIKNDSILIMATSDKIKLSIDGPNTPWLLIILLLILLGGSVSFFGEKTVDNSNNANSSILPTDTRQPRVYTVSYKSGVFSPTNLRIHAGDTVRFKNEGIFPIRIVGDDLVGFDSIGDVPQGSFFAFTIAA